MSSSNLRAQVDGQMHTVDTHSNILIGFITKLGLDTHDLGCLIAGNLLLFYRAEKGRLNAPLDFRLLAIRMAVAVKQLFKLMAQRVFNII